MLSIYRHVNRILSSYKDKHPEFQEGMKLVLGLFKVGIEKHVHFNYAIKNNELIKENKQLKNENAHLKKLLSVNENSLYVPTTTEKFKEYTVLWKDNQKFKVTTNLDEHTMNMCVSVFSVGDNSKTLPEFKNKLMWFINAKNSAGFYAFKNMKQAKEQFNL